MSVRLVAFSDLEWESARPAPEEADSPPHPVRRKWLARGQSGFFAQYVQMPPGNVVKAHSHDRDELMMVVKGGCRFDDRSDLTSGDSAVVAAGTPYGFVVGADGIEFLIVRTGESTLTRVGSPDTTT